MKKSLRLSVLLLAPLALLFFSHCKKDVLGDGKISFSTDTLTFDTVFVSTGSTTNYFKVFNNTSRTIKIDEIRLLHLVGNQFRINVDAVTGDRFTNVEIAPRDSAYVYVEVTVDPTSSTTPFVIIDDVQFSINGEVQTVHLQAWGQNAHFHYGQEIASGKTETWANDLPHIIVSRDTVPGVYVRCGGKLIIQPGCKVFFGNNAAIFVEGELQAVANSWSDSISFSGVRLEPYYNDKPGQWFGIVFLRNNDCGGVRPKGTFEHCMIDESSYGIYAGAGLSSNIPDYQGLVRRPDVTISKCIVKNSLYHAVYGFNAEIRAKNSIFYASGDYLLNLGLGGIYDFNQCTMYNTGSKFVNHQKEILLLSNFAINVATRDIYPEPIKSSFTNCVLYGSLKNEISFNSYSETDPRIDFDNSFSYCLLKSNADTVNIFSAVNLHPLYNEEPKFKEANVDFTPSDSAGYFSPIIDYAPTGLGDDIFGTSRPVIKVIDSMYHFDIGAVEAQIE